MLDNETYDSVDNDILVMAEMVILRCYDTNSLMIRILLITVMLTIKNTSEADIKFIGDNEYLPICPCYPHVSLYLFVCFCVCFSECLAPRPISELTRSCGRYLDRPTARVGPPLWATFATH